jgi:hypothetical protein
MKRRQPAEELAPLRTLTNPDESSLPPTPRIEQAG